VSATAARFRGGGGRRRRYARGGSVVELSDLNENEVK